MAYSPDQLRNVLDRLLIDMHGQENETTWALRVAISVQTEGVIAKALAEHTSGVENLWPEFHEEEAAIRRALTSFKNRETEHG